MRRDLTELNKLLGQKFGRLTVIEILPTKEFNDTRRPLFRSMALCRCDCGTIKSIIVKNLKCGGSKSCGCARTESVNQIHFDRSRQITESPLSGIWQGIRDRCYDKNCKSYPHYGGRGIKVCDEWNNSSFDFIKWGMNNGYEKGLQIDRINNDGDYEPSNCRFVTAKQNCRNRRSNKLIEYKGEIKPLCEWAEIFSIRGGTVNERLSRGWEFEKAVLHPLQLKQKRK